jgi:aspartyl-tRNA(Asn)/glutamyl-tRNA(Gln) amidotransferase subunit A
METHGGVRGLRIAFSPTLGYIKVDPEVGSAVLRAIGQFVSLGAFVDQVDPGFASPRGAFDVLWEAGAATVVGGFNSSQQDSMDPGILRAARRSADASAMNAAQSEVARSQLGTLMAMFHKRFDLLITPTVAVPAIKAGEEVSDPTTEREWLDWAGFSYPFNMTRQPAISIPCGMTSDGLPIGLQIVGPLYSDALVLRAARAYEASTAAPSWPPLSSSLP